MLPSSRAVNEPAHLTGHAWGAYVAAATAFRYPELVRSLTPVNTASLSFEYDGEAVSETRIYYVYHELRNGEVAHNLAVLAVRTEFLTSEFVAQCAEEFGRLSNLHSREVIGGPARKVAALSGLAPVTDGGTARQAPEYGPVGPHNKMRRTT